MRISDWSSDVCSSDLRRHVDDRPAAARDHRGQKGADHPIGRLDVEVKGEIEIRLLGRQYRAGMDEAAAVEEDVGAADLGREGCDRRPVEQVQDARRSEEHSSELQSLMRNTYAVFCLKK